MFSKVKNFAQEFAQLYFNKRMLVIGTLGYGSGLPFSLVFISYTFYLAELGISLKSIGFYGLAGLPFAIKFIWAPLVDGMKIPLLHRFGQRRSWLLVSQVVLMIIISYFGFLDPRTQLTQVALLAVILSFVSATYDIAYDAIRVELLKEDEQGAGAGVSILGYRIGMLMSTGIALVIAEIHSWQVTFISIGLSLSICTIATLFSKEPEKNLSESVAQKSIKKWLQLFVVEPFVKFAQQHKNWIIIILFAITYKLGDSLMSKMMNPFYVEMGFTKIEVAEITKFFGFLMTIVGAMIGGWAVYKFGILRTLIVFGILQALSNFTFVWLAHSGHDLFVLTCAIIAENITGAMGTAAFTAYLSSLCNIRYTATQYALLTSFMSLGRWMTNAPAGMMVDKAGMAMSWETYFTISVLVSIPGLLLIKFLKINDKNRLSREELKNLADGD